jgi:hypothetical protein
MYLGNKLEGGINMEDYTVGIAKRCVQPVYVEEVDDYAVYDVDVDKETNKINRITFSKKFTHEKVVLNAYELRHLLALLRHSGYIPYGFETLSIKYEVTQPDEDC